MPEFNGLCIGGPKEGQMVLTEAPYFFSHAPSRIAVSPDPATAQDSPPADPVLYRHYNVRFGDFTMFLWVPEPHGLAWAMQRVLATYANVHAAVDACVPPKEGA